MSLLGSTYRLQLTVDTGVGTALVTPILTTQWSGRWAEEIAVHTDVLAGVIVLRVGVVAARPWRLFASRIDNLLFE